MGLERRRVSFITSLPGSVFPFGQPAIQPLFYDIPTIWIALAIFLSMIAAIEAGYRVGLRHMPRISERSRTQINTLQSMLFAVIALLLGFTFSQSLARFDSRAAAVVNEANAIGTAWLRSGLLAEPYRGEAAALYREYSAQRAAAGHVALDDEAETARHAATAGALQMAIWDLAGRAMAADPVGGAARLHVQAVNDMIDSYGLRRAALDRHLPAIAIGMLMVTFVMAGATLGYTCGVSGHRVSLPTYGLAALVVVITFIIIDLDRPRRGLLEVNQKSMVELRDSIAAGD